MLYTYKYKKEIESLKSKDFLDLNYNITEKGFVALELYRVKNAVILAAGIIALIIGSALTQVTEREKQERELLFIIPESEGN